MNDKRIVFTSKGKVQLEDYHIPEISDNQLKVKNTLSLMSTGTENIVLNQLFDKDSHWANWGIFPFYPGYSTIGVVEKTGKNVSGLKKGDKVIHRMGHASTHVVDEKDCYPVPETVKDEDAVWFGLAKIGAMGARKARHTLGDAVLIIGAGPIGQMSIRWAVAAGANPIIVVDTMPMRLEMAKKGGATHLISKPVGESKELIKSITGGKGTDVTIDTTGNFQVFADAIMTPRHDGRFVLLGDTGTPAKQHLVGGYISTGIEIVGAHDCQEPNPFPVYELFLRLVEQGRFKMDGLSTHFFKGNECVDAYRTVNEKRGETMGVYFDWK